MAIEDTRQFDNHTFSISATPFRFGKDSGVADHGKYLALSKQVFAIPEIGSVTVSMDIAAETPGTVRGRVVHGTYVQSGARYEASVRQGQQAAATLHMIDFATGQLFDWFVSGSTAFPFIERLPSSVSGSAEHVSTDKMYSQIIDEVPIAPGVAHTVAIRYSRDRQGSRVEYLLAGKRVSQVERVGIPLDVQGMKYSGTYPSIGPRGAVAGQDPLGRRRARPLQRARRVPVPASGCAGTERFRSDAGASVRPGREGQVCQRHRRDRRPTMTWTRHSGRRKVSLSMFRLRIFHSSVWRGMPSFAAAPRGPATRPRVSWSAASINAFSPSTRVVTAVPFAGVRGLRASHDSSITKVSPSLKTRARSITFWSSRTLPGQS